MEHLLLLCFCYVNRPHTFTQLIQVPISSVETRHSGDGRYYKTEDKVLTSKYQYAMESMRFRKKIFPFPESEGGSSITVTDAKGVTHSIRSGPRNFFSIDGVWYKASSSRNSEMAWKGFSQNFYNDSNRMPQK
ncbi:hypothetical protein MJA45_24085 [Paenibacillus aurantius]|uniref:Uncharacterized protein n=1 Tax=Paenibacillus aurantius TaxID=2918900 RepID=A0AA96LEL9_9BACL|nr:hypothetical protein [Paenibacillus aurantius]WNQ10666.1 hypothetical protein MJA45_24085 [Paenibacillus aurantius]